MYLESITKVTPQNLLLQPHQELKVAV